MRYKLVIDIGNTAIKAGVFAGETLLRCDVIYRYEDLQSLCSTYKIDSLISCTVSEMPDFVIEYAKKIESKIIWDTHLKELKFPIELQDYSSSVSLGKDRVAIASALSTIYPNTNVLSIALGSCITYNFVDSNKRFLGGSISPGLFMRFKALNSYTHALPLIEEKYLAKCFIGDNIFRSIEVKDTKEALLKGVVNGVLYEIEAVINAYELSYTNIKVVLTGGDLKYFENSIKSRIFAHPNLTLYGLNKILDINEL